MAAMDPDTLRTSDLDYRLPAELIAQRPLSGRDRSRLLVIDRAAGTLRDRGFRDLPLLLREGDLLVLNDTKVVPAKITARRAGGGKIDGLFLRELGEGRWEVLLSRTRRLRPGERLQLHPADCGDILELIGHEGAGRWTVRLVSNDATGEVLGRVGRTPLPPYIHRPDQDDGAEAIDRGRYQTIFADRPGAVAAPTAALHFTEGTLEALDSRGVQRVCVTLHIGPGTFAPVTVQSLDDHAMHEEWFDMPHDAASRIEACRAAGSGRVVAVGTTSVRVLETCASEGGIRAGSGWTNLFIRPPYTFRAVDALLTNFHLPRSTLLALVMTFAGRGLVREAYAHAIENGYRFYSYGDAMLIL